MRSTPYSVEPAFSASPISRKLANYTGWRVQCAVNMHVGHCETLNDMSTHVLMQARCGATQVVSRKALVVSHVCAHGPQDANGTDFLSGLPLQTVVCPRKYRVPSTSQ